MAGVDGKDRTPEPKPGSLERFTDRARKVLALGQEEAQRFNHHYVDSPVGRRPQRSLRLQAPRRAKP